MFAVFVLAVWLGGCGLVNSELKELGAEDLWSVVERVSVRWMPQETNGASPRAALSADGRFIAFESAASNLVADDANGVADVFVFDRQTGAIDRVSIADDGTEADGRSRGPSISTDGRYVAFDSVATNLAPGNASGREVYVRDRTTAETRWVSFGLGMVDSDASARSPAISGDGNVIAFQSSASNLTADGSNGQSHIFVHTRATGQTERVSVANDGALANGGSFSPSISADGNLVAFQSVATNLADDALFHADIFVRDRSAQEIKRVSVAADGSEADARSILPSLSADGRYISFLSSATNLIAGDTNGVDDVYVIDLLMPSSTRRISVATDGSEADAGSGLSFLSADGRHVGFSSEATNLVAGDTNGQSDVFIHDRASQQTVRVSVSSQGTEADLGSHAFGISGDGERLAFSSAATNLVSGDSNGFADIFLRDRGLDTTIRATAVCKLVEGNARAWGASASKDSRYVVFASRASNLVEDDANGVDDVFLYDRASGLTERISRAPGGVEADGPSDHASITPDGRYIVFRSTASNLVPGDSNGTADIFLHDRDTGATSRVSVSSTGTEGNGAATAPSISEDGRFVAFESSASNLVADDDNGTTDVFLFDRSTGLVRRIAVVIHGTGPDGSSFTPHLSLDGNAIAFESRATNLADSDSNGDKWDAFVFDLATREVEHLSTEPLIGVHGGAGGGPLSQDGRYVGFVANIVIVTSPVVVTSRRAFVYDRTTRQITEKLGDEAPFHYILSARISPDGERLSFTVPGADYDPDGFYDADLFVQYLELGEAAFVARRVGAYQSTLEGNHMVFSSFHPEVVADDTNDVSDVFVALRGTGPDLYSGPRCGG